MDLGGAVALVTGASGGLGARFSEVLAAHGAQVALAARRTDRLEALEAAIGAAGGHAASFAFDAEDPEAADRLVAAVEDRLGRPAILVNNAGISLPGKAHESPLADFERTVAVNLRAPWQLSQIVVKRWIAADSGGTIVNVSSFLSRRVTAGLSLYAMSKAALRHLTAAQALEWARHGVRVNALCPGFIRTEINDAHWETPRGQAELSRLPRKRVGDPADLDSALLFLVDPRSHFVNGEALTVDDGQSWAV